MPSLATTRARAASYLGHYAYRPVDSPACVDRLRIGVVAVQGAFVEHRDAFARAFALAGIDGEAALVRTREELARCDAAALPGGESTTISKLLITSGMGDLLVERVQREDFPVFATCAGLILLAKEGDRQVETTRTRLLGLMDLTVNRNAFGRQRESFEADVDVEGLREPFHAVFIRAPAVTRTWGTCQPLGAVDASLATGADPLTGWTPPNVGKVVVAARQGNRFGFAFHPELTDDARLHAEFVRAVAAWKRERR